MRTRGASLGNVGVVCAVVSLCFVWSAAPASGHSHYLFTGSFGTAGSGAGEMSLSTGSLSENGVAGSGVAVNSTTHDVYVADTGNHRIDEFEADGSFVRAWGWGVATGAAELQTCTVSCQEGLSGSAPGEFEAPTYIAVDNSPSGGGDVYVADTGDSLVSKFDAEGGLIESWGVKGQLDGSSAPQGTFLEKSTGYGGIEGIAVDTSGNLWIAVHRKKILNEYVYEFGQGGSFTQSWQSYPAAEGARGIAVDGSGNLYFNADVGTELLRTTSSGVVIGREGDAGDGKVIKGPNGFITGIAADLVANEIYVDAGGSVERFASGCQTIGNFSEGCVPLESFGPPRSAGGGALTVDSSTGTVYLVKPGSDLVEAYVPEVHEPPAIENQSVSSVTSSSATFSATVNPVGSDTSYHFEYGLTPSYGGIAPVVEGLIGSGFEGHEVSVHVQGLVADAMYYFRIAARNEKGTTYGEEGSFLTQASSNTFALPDGRSWELVTPAEKHGALFFAQNSGMISSTATKPFVAEAAAGGDAMVDLASAPTEAEPQGIAEEESVLSTRERPGEWSSQDISPPRNFPSGPSQGGEYHFFSEDLSRGVVLPFGDHFTPLSPEATEPTSYLRTNYFDGNVDDHCETSCYRPLVTAADKALGFKNEEEEGECRQQACGVSIGDATPDAQHIVVGNYEWSEGQFQPIFLLPDGTSGAGSFNTLDHSLSDDGSVLFSAEGHLYLHDFARDNSVRLDFAQGVAEPVVGGASFLYASSDGSRVLFSDTQRLTSAVGGGVYECRIVEEEAGVPKCELDLTGLSWGSLIGGSDDASYLYFESNEGKLIVDHRTGSEWTTTTGPSIGTLPESDAYQNREYRPVTRVSPDGRYLTFMSDEKLTSYDNNDVITGQPDVEVYLYEAIANKLVCASCNPTGARPVGTEYDQEDLVAGSLLEAFAPNNPRVAANLPPWTKAGVPGGGGESLYQPRFLSDSGRLFFDSYGALEPSDVNGTQDVYEYEPPGIGDCATGSATFSARAGGCVSLISSGSSAEESAFMDASETGGDVFFITAAKLSSEDFDSALDVYDAHECSPESPCAMPMVSPPPCSTGDSCKAAPSPQPTIFGAPASSTFTGAGNVTPTVVVSVKPKSLTRAQQLALALKACRKDGRKKRGVCERIVRKKYGPVKGHVKVSGKASVKRKGGR